MPVSKPSPFVLASAVSAAAAPSLLAWNVSPSPTALNQALAIAVWGLFVAVSAPATPGRRPWPLWAALGALAIAAASSSLLGALPATLGLSAIGLLAATALVAAGGAGAAARSDRVDVFAAFAWGWLVAGACSVAIAAIQVFAPGWSDGDWIARSGIPGRAVGNLRQPNHLSSLLLWSCIAAVALVELRRLSWAAGAAALTLAVGGVVLSASRTGLVSVLLLALWGLADRRLARRTRALLVAAPLVYAACWAAMAQWAALSDHTFGGAARLAESDISSSRFGIWANTLALIRAHPWTGVGFGEFNLAWTLTPFPGRPTAFFDHTHNLPLQLLVELGLPLGGAVLALLVLALWRGGRDALRPDADADASLTRRAAMLVVAMIGLHSLLEYPLWYAYFLLPAAWAWGYAIGGPCAVHPARPAAPASPVSTPAGWLRGGGLALVVGAVLLAADYARVTGIFVATPGAAPLADRIADGRRSVFFGHHADYAAATSGIAPADPLAAFDRAPHYLLDTRLMIAWAQALAAAGRVDEARALADRLREFRKTDAAAFFDACTVPASAAVPPPSAASGAVPRAVPFQCLPLPRPPGWGAYVGR